MRGELGVDGVAGDQGVEVRGAAVALGAQHAAEALGLPMPEMPPDAQARLKAAVPFAAPRNPVDCTAQAFNDMSLIGRFTDSMIEDGGFYYVIGYGQNINIPTIDVISREISFIGNLVGTYVDLQDLMTLTAQGKVTLHTSTYPLDAINDAMADLDNGRLQGRGILVPANVPAHATA